MEGSDRSAGGQNPMFEIGLNVGGGGLLDKSSVLILPMLRLCLTTSIFQLKFFLLIRVKVKKTEETEMN